MRQSLFESLEGRYLLAGVTLITHGFEFSAGLPNWLATMETSLSKKMGGANIYRLTITGGSNPAVSSFTRISANGASTGEAIIDLDWSACSNSLFYPSVSTATIANLVKPYLTTARNLAGDPLTAHPLAEMPIHIAGHSRGGSLVADLARKLAADGLWVDQLTLWDPYPVGPDPAVNVSDNVVFADEVFQNNSSPSGTATAGAHNINLTGISGVGHSETHAFYEGTIDRAAATDGDGITINNNWYTSAGAPRATSGYDWSRVGSGAQPADGIGALAGGTATRTHVSVTSATPWPDIGSVDVSGGVSGFIVNGDALDLKYRYQDSNAAGGSSVSFYLDNDTNPYDGFAKNYGSVTGLGSTGATPNVSGLLNFAFNWSSSGLGDGMYRVAAKITNPAGETRYAYMGKPIYVTAGGAEIVTKRFTNDLANSDWTSASNFLPGGAPRGGDHDYLPGGSISIASDSSNQSFILDGTSTITFSASQHVAGLTIASVARANLAANGNELLQTNTLSLASGAKLDLNDNDLIVNSGNFSTIQAMVFAGYRQSADSGASGIISSTAQTAAGNPILALFDNAFVHASDYPFGSGNTIGSDSIVGKYTYVGDTNWDGQVTPDDYGALDANLGATNVSPGIGWFTGDTNFDGSVTPDDYGALDANLGRGTANPLAAPESVGAPEPLVVRRNIFQIV